MKETRPLPPSTPTFCLAISFPYTVNPVCSEGISSGVERLRKGLPSRGCVTSTENHENRMDQIKTKIQPNAKVKYRLHSEGGGVSWDIRLDYMKMFLKARAYLKRSQKRSLLSKRHLKPCSSLWTGHHYVPTTSLIKKNKKSYGSHVCPLKSVCGSKDEI